VVIFNNNAAAAMTRCCIKCKLELDVSMFRCGKLNIWICKPCGASGSSQHRRRDPGTRLAVRLRAQGHRLGVAEVREILFKFNALRAAERDEVTIVPARRDEPLTVQNAKVVPRARRCRAPPDPPDEQQMADGTTSELLELCLRKLLEPPRSVPDAMPLPPAPAPAPCAPTPLPARITPLGAQLKAALASKGWNTGERGVIEVV